MKELTFKETHSLALFGKLCGATELRTFVNDETGKKSFRAGGLRGAIATKFDEAKPMLVSSVIGVDNEAFWLLHNEGEGADLTQTGTIKLQ